LVKKVKTLSSTDRKGLHENAIQPGFILRMLRTLGWSVDNVNEVCPEEMVFRQFVGFPFRISGIPRYFLEIRKFSADQNNPGWLHPHRRRKAGGTTMPVTAAARTGKQKPVGQALGQAGGTLPPVRRLLQLRTRVRITMQKRIQALDAQIDRLVYKLYGLTEEPPTNGDRGIKIMEGSNA
jgi:hypothetical protein